MFFARKNTLIKGIIWVVALMFILPLVISSTGFLRSRNLRKQEEERKKAELEREQAKYEIKEEDKNVVLAKFGEEKITVEDFYTYFRKLNAEYKNSYTTIEQRENILDYVVEKKIVENYALNKSITVEEDERVKMLYKLLGDKLKDVDIEKVKEMLKNNYFDVNQLDYAVKEDKIKRLLTDDIKGTDDKTLREYYNNHKYRYQLPDEYFVSHLFISKDNKKREESIDVSDEKLERYYKNNSDKYLGKPSVRLKGIFIDKNKTTVSKITDEKAREYYDNNIEEFKDEEQVKASHILVNSLELAKKVQKEILSGKNFGELAKKYSDDPGSKDKEGDLGWFGRGKMVAEFDKKVFSMKKGSVSEPVKTNFGYHIIKLIDVKKEYQKTFDEVKAKLVKRLQDEELWNKTKERAMAAYKKLDERVSFTDVVKEFSNGKTKVDGGEIGWVRKGKNSIVEKVARLEDEIFYKDENRKGTMLYELEREAFSLNRGEFSTPIKTDFGYNILYVVDKKKAEVLAYSEIKGKVKTDYLDFHKDMLAYNLIIDVKQKLDNQELNFEDAAKKYSDAPSASKKGQLPWFSLGIIDKDNKDLIETLKEDKIASFTYFYNQGRFETGDALNKNIEKEIKYLNKNEISDVVKTENGYHLVRFEDRRKGSFKSFDSVREEMKAELDITVPSDDIKQYYMANKEAKYTQPKMYKIANILIDDKEKIFKAYERLQKGEDFAELAKEVSVDYTKDNGGEIGFVKEGEKSEALENAFKELKKGEYSKPVETDFGWQIVKLLDVKDKIEYSMESKKAEIVDELKSPMRDKFFRSWITEQKNKFIVEKEYTNFDYLVKYN